MAKGKKGKENGEGMEGECVSMIYCSTYTVCTVMLTECVGEPVSCYKPSTDAVVRPAFCWLYNGRYDMD